MPWPIRGNAAGGRGHPAPGGRVEPWACCVDGVCAGHPARVRLCGSPQPLDAVLGPPAMTTRLSLFLILALGLAAAVVTSSCGATRCGPGMCAGCCDSSGACVGGTETAACGSSGAACSACTGGTCSAGTCSAADAGAGGGAGGGTADAGACGNCNGCCQNGVCRAGSATNACGASGATCVDCISQNRICVAGRCQTQPWRSARSSHV